MGLSLGVPQLLTWSWGLPPAGTHRPRDGVLDSAREDSRSHRLRLVPPPRRQRGARLGGGVMRGGALLGGALRGGAGLCGAGLRAFKPALESSRSQGGGSRKSYGRLDSHQDLSLFSL